MNIKTKIKTRQSLSSEEKVRMKFILCITFLCFSLHIRNTYAAGAWGVNSKSINVQACSSDLLKKEKDIQLQTEEKDEEVYPNMEQGCNLAIQSRKEKRFFRQGEVLVRRIRPGDIKSEGSSSQTARWV